MAEISNFVSRNAFVDDSDAQLRRIHHRQKVLFNDLGPFDVWLIRINKTSGPQNEDYKLMSVSEKQTSVLRSSSVMELEEHLLKSNYDNFRIL
jgi:hypothetical protein